MDQQVEKTLLSVVENGFVARSFFHSDFLPLIKQSFKSVVVLAPLGKLEEYRAAYQKDNIIIEPMLEEKNSIIKKLLFKFLKNSIKTRSNRLMLMNILFKRNGRPELKLDWLLFIPFYISWYLSGFKFWRKFLRKLFSLTKPDKKVLEILKKYQPDVIFARYSSIGLINYNIKLFQAARAVGIKTVANIFSWDNLYTKVFVAQDIDYLTVGTAIVKKEAMRLADVAENKLQVLGLPQFDFYFKPELILERQEFLESIGADPAKRLVIFAIGTNDARHLINQEHFLKLFSNLAKELGLQFYVRSHPKAKTSDYLIGKFKNDPGIIFENREGYKTGADFSFKQGDEQLLVNLFKHSNLVITFYSTILIEACIFDKPVININYSAGMRNGYFSRIKRYKEYEHIDQILKNNSAKWVNNDQQTIASIKEYLENPAKDSIGRKKTVEEQVFFTDGDSARRVVNFLVEVL